MSGAGAQVLGVVVPARNEAAVLGRKLANLARAAWPPLAEGLRHRLVVVDDESDDGTAELARALLARLFPAGGAVDARCVANTRGAGKAGAVQSGLAALGVERAPARDARAVALVVLTDADVVLEPDALVELARAFAADGRLALACGAQRFVRDLAADGRPLGADGAPPRDAGDVFDRWSAKVRALESRGGRLFSVHGQLLAWRAGEGLAPSPGLAADDLDLMLQARSPRRAPAVPGERRRVVRVARARFLERKTPRGEASRGQDLRRARAYFAALADRGPAPLGRAPLDRLQWAFYARVPRLAPELGLVALAALGAGAVLLAETAGALLLVGLALALRATPAGRRTLELARCIRLARRTAGGAVEPSEPGPLGADRWEMQRT